jgi:LytS/YehU family sensor histidine kinase
MALMNCRALALVILLLFINPVGVRAQEALQEDVRVQMVVMFAMAPILIALAFIVFVLYRKKREAFFRQQETELRLQIAETELKALRAQINPHFIFNCLNSIHHFILKSEAKLAGDYLAKFSQLIRLILENSLHKTIPLRDELHALNLYVELEQMRLDHAFKYKLGIGDEVDQDTVEIPPLLIQPFVENSIWHGLANVSAGGELTVTISSHGDMLACVIENTGSGFKVHRNDGPADRVKKASIGLALVQERLDILNRSHTAKSSFVLSEISKAANVSGVRVDLRIPKL